MRLRQLGGCRCHCNTAHVPISANAPTLPHPLAPCCCTALCAPAGSVATLEVTAPSLSTPTGQLPAYDRGPGRFSGNHYIKCFSPAWMHEWIAIEGLRR